ncbi:MAG: HAMP domain-containing protein [Paenibacillaceae bacterium]|nr:HAMP domain-containing protein [Paenibacillaceae bacterium]
MKKSIAVLLALVLLLAAAGNYLYRNWSTLRHLPTETAMKLGNMSLAVTDDDNNAYIIGGSKKTIIKTDAGGTVAYKIRQPSDQPDLMHNFNDLAVDGNGFLYTVDTLLDSFGFVVKEERVIRYTPRGEFDAELFRIDSSKLKNGKGDSLMRVGSIKALQLREDGLYFFLDEVSKFTLMKVAKGEKEAKPVYTGTLPDGKTLNEVRGTAPGSIVFSTRSGEVYRDLGNGSSELLYPLPTIDRTRLNFPESIGIDGKGRLSFIDFRLKMISRIDRAEPYVLESLLTEEKAQELGLDLDFFDLYAIRVAQDGAVTVASGTDVFRRAADGSIDLNIRASDLHYSAAIMSGRWLVWAVAVVSALGLLWAVKLLYVNIMRRRISLILKQIFVFVPIIVASMGLVSYVVYTNFSAKLEDETIRELALLARNGQNLIDGDRLERIKSPADYMDADFRLFHDKMKGLFESDQFNFEGFYRALYKYENGQLYRIIEDDDSYNMFRPFPTTEQNSLVATTGAIVTDKWNDDTGYWMYAIGPVYNSSGKIVGVYETSKNLEGILQHRRMILVSTIRNIAIITSVLLVIFLLMTYYLLSSIRKLRGSVTRFAKGQWDAVVDIKTRDEVSDLGDNFNFMAGHIRDYIVQITNASEAYYRFVPQQFLQSLGKESILDVQLGDQVEKEMHILVCNIRSFYQFSKRLTPEENFNFINSFLKRFSPYIRSHEGWINKYLGAGIMALFSNAADESLLAAIEMRRELELYNVHRDNTGYVPIDIGIGIHRGPLRLGIVGEEKRMEGNVISDDVNVASMVEKLTDTLGASILITDDFARQLSGNTLFQYRNLGLIRDEESDKPLQLYDVYQGDPDTIRTLKERTKAQFEQAIQLYQVGRFYDAREAFVQVIKINRQDKAAKLYFYICDEYYQKGAAADWNGTLYVS